MGGGRNCFQWPHEYDASTGRLWSKCFPDIISLNSHNNLMNYILLLAFYDKETERHEVRKLP